MATFYYGDHMEYRFAGPFVMLLLVEYIYTQDRTAQNKILIILVPLKLYFPKQVYLVAYIKFLI